MGKDLRGKELEVGICQRKDGLYTARFVSKRTGKSVQKYFPKLQECRKWYADAKFEDEHGGINASGDMTVTAWFDYWIENIKGEREKSSNYNQFALILQTGLRTGELIGLKWSDIDWEKRVIHIQRSMEYRYSVGEWRIGEPKSKSGYRDVLLTEEAVAILKRQKEKLREIKVINMQFKDYVFLCRKGEPTKNSVYDTSLFKLCDKAGIRRFLMHTMATRCIEGEMRPKTLQVILGHANVGITMNLYIHVTEDEKVKEVERIESALKIV